MALHTHGKSTGTTKRTTKSGHRKARPAVTGRASALTRSGGKRNPRATSAIRAAIARKKK